MDGGASALPRPLEILHGAGNLLGRFEMVSVDCPLTSRPSSSSSQAGGDDGDCGMGGTSSSFSSSSATKHKHDRVWGVVHHLITAGFAHWRCNGHACHFARLREEDLALAAYYHRIRSLHVNQVCQCVCVYVCVLQSILISILLLYKSSFSHFSFSQPIARSPEEGAPERRDKCLDEIYHEEITWDLRPGLRKREFA